MGLGHGSPLHHCTAPPRSHHHRHTLALRSHHKPTAPVPSFFCYKPSQYTFTLSAFISPTAVVASKPWTPPLLYIPAFLGPGLLGPGLLGPECLAEFLYILSPAYSHRLDPLHPHLHKLSQYPRSIPTTNLSTIQELVLPFNL